MPSRYLLSACFLLLSTVICCVGGGRRPLNVNLMTFGYSQPIYTGAIPYVGPAYDMALEDIRERYGSVLNITHTYLLNHTKGSCDSVENVEALLAEFYYRTEETADLTTMINPGCNDPPTTGLLASQWNILQITTASDAGFKQERRMNPTWISLATGTISNVVLAIRTLLEDWAWRNIYLVWDTGSSPMYKSLTSATQNSLKNASVGKEFQTTLRTLNVPGDPAWTLLEMLAEFRKSSRIMIFFGHSNSFRRTLIAAAGQNMTNGDYIYIAIQSLYHMQICGNFSWKYDDADDLIAKTAYESVLLLAAEHPEREEYEKDPFLRECRQRSRSTYNLTYFEPSPYLKATYAGVFMLAEVLNETYISEPAFDWKDGESLAGKFLRRTYHSRVGLTGVSRFGDAVVNLSLRASSPTGDYLQVVKQWDSENQRYLNVSSIYWPNGYGPPPNVPVCGYEGLSCHDPADYVPIVAGVIGAVCVAIGAAIMAGYRIRSRAAQALISDRSWVLDALLVQSVSMQDSMHWTRVPPQAISCYAWFSRSRLDMMEPSSTTAAAHVVGKALYDGNYIWSKCLHTLPIGGNNASSMMTRYNPSLQLLMSQIRGVTHPCINRTVGLYAGPSLGRLQWIHVVSQWCPRGSLHDLFQSASVTVDVEFRCSLVCNLVEGLNFIHTQPVKFHGNLSGSRCLIDQHFTLRISQVGSYQLQNLLQLPADNNRRYRDPTRFFWTAPEVLRHECPPSQLTDVYSLAMILYEILLAKQPYQNDHGIDPHEILRALTRNSGILRNEPILRPSFTNQELQPEWIDLIEHCWDENPFRRPDLRHLRHAVHHIMDSMDLKCGRLSYGENVLQRFLLYSSQLEQEVSNRTAMLFTEKAKYDRLLEEMLPRTLVLRLQRGEAVTPEVYDSVTISFSSLDGMAEPLSRATPCELILVMNHFFEVLDTATAGLVVHKVRTAGDLYMMACGIPDVSHMEHAREMCLISQKMQHLFEASGREDINLLQLRIGIHTGSCAAGVIGGNRPRYYLFGEAVKTASQMCQYGEGDRIHLSQTTADVLLDNFPHFHIVPRGRIAIHNRKRVLTYWLLF
ncbi:atrial natriuretic peptide receptor 1-like [Paramacrobiotus metropolitanus]|uniref:atrial natriuretic peptide receptor 1-like n=1 Tax=Paramacrobiotus metropolitanus TaxID=2943436 RepID=UPI00244643D4|nr:atrial natriuretic peptide receptor 1-like [Paramacrobiotus metropolitanus]